MTANITQAIISITRLFITINLTSQANQSSKRGHYLISMFSLLARGETEIYSARNRFIVNMVPHDSKEKHVHCHHTHTHTHTFTCMYTLTDPCWKARQKIPFTMAWQSLFNFVNFVLNLNLINEVKAWISQVNNRWLFIMFLASEVYKKKSILGGSWIYYL